jgi:hypothetical protein
MVSITHASEVLLEWAKVGKVKTHVAECYASYKKRVTIRCEITDYNWTFEINDGWGEEEDLKILKYNLDKIEAELYTLRGKHLSKSYDFYTKAAPPRYASGGMYDPITWDMLDEEERKEKAKATADKVSDIVKKLKEKEALDALEKHARATKAASEAAKKLNSTIEKIRPVLDEERKKKLDEIKGFGSF